MSEKIEDGFDIDDDDFLDDDDFSEDNDIDDDEEKSNERKRLLKIISLVFVWIVFVGGGFFYLFIYDSSSPKPSTQSTAPQSSTERAVKTEFLSSRDPRQDSEDAFQSLLLEQENNDKFSSQHLDEIKALRSDINSIFATLSSKIDNIPTECQQMPNVNLPPNARSKVQMDRLNNTIITWKQKYADLQVECSSKPPLPVNAQKPLPFNEQQLRQLKAVIVEVLAERDKQKALSQPEKNAEPRDDKRFQLLDLE